MLCLWVCSRAASLPLLCCTCFSFLSGFVSFSSLSCRALHGGLAWLYSGPHTLRYIHIYIHRGVSKRLGREGEGEERTF